MTLTRISTERRKVRRSRPPLTFETSGLTVGPYDGSDEDWDGFVADAEGSSFCHLSGWRETMSDVLGAEPAYIAARDQDAQCRGVLPLMHVRSRLFGHYLISMPFLNYGGPLGSQAARRYLGEASVALAKHAGAGLLELRSREAYPSDLRVSRRKIIVQLALPRHKEELWLEAFSAKLRSQIKRPLKDGMEVRFGTGQLLAFYEVFARNMRDLGTPVLPRAFFERIVKVFRDLVTVGVVYLGRKPVAAGCGFVWNGEFEMTWAASLREHSRQAPNMLLYWSFMERMIDQGAKVFNFGRCTSGGGTHRFKGQWGGVDVPLAWQQWSSRGRQGTPTSDGSLYRLGVATWRRLPLAIANAAGPVLARSLP